MAGFVVVYQNLVVVFNLWIKVLLLIANSSNVFTNFFQSFEQLKKKTDFFNSFMRSFLEFILSNSPIYFHQILFIFFCLIKSRAIDSLEYASKKSSRKQTKQNLEKINWRIGENRFEKIP